jgi:HSP20 family protein
VKREEVQIEQIGNELAISGEFKEKEHTGVLRKQTRRTGQFAYRVVLPEQVDTEMVQAKLSDGVLTVTIPKSTKAAHKKIEIAS